MSVPANRVSVPGGIACSFGSWVDPPVRADGLCVHCGAERKVPARVRYALRTVYEADPFCRTKCAREWHGVSPPPVVRRGRPRIYDDD